MSTSGTVPIKLALLAATASSLAFGLSVTLDPSTPSPAPLGTVVTWQATPADANSGALWYRFRTREIGQDFRVVKDFGPDTTLDWTSIEHEGLYQVEVDVRNTDTGETARARAYFELQSLVQGGRPAITPTAHPLVALYSLPACPVGARVRVRTTGPGGASQNTPFQDCTAGVSVNFYLAGFRASSTYSVQHAIDTGSAFQNGPVLTFTTPALEASFVAETVIKPAPAPVQKPVLLQATTASNPVATDLAGNVIWYYPGTFDFNMVGPFLITRPERGGYFFGLIENTSGARSDQRLREFDLTGRTVLETNAERVGDQLVAMGKRRIGSFHHEASRLPDGRIITIATVEQVLSDVQGPGPVDIIGDMIVVLDRDLQVVWAWDAFDHLDVTRTATLGDICPFGGCPPLFLDTKAHDWLHGNSVVQTPDGALLYSARSQDWVIKLDYDNGDGAGDIIWKLGKDGDFQFNSTDPYPWFSHQHDPNFLPDNTTVVLFDNGNVRKTSDANANSRGQVIHLDEQNRVATLVLNADLGQFSGALGSAQHLPNGDFHFNLGVVPGSSSTALEVNSAGQTVYGLSVAAPEYRSFRMTDLYTP